MLNLAARVHVSHPGGERKNLVALKLARAASQRQGDVLGSLVVDVGCDEIVGAIDPSASLERKLARVNSSHVIDERQTHV